LWRLLLQGSTPAAAKSANPQPAFLDCRLLQMLQTHEEAAREMQRANELLKQAEAGKSGGGCWFTLAAVKGICRFTC